jgi:hypothetical protein
MRAFDAGDFSEALALIDEADALARELDEVCHG